MALADGVADLHLHTTASDGTCGVGDRLDHAREHDLETIAITDHDCIADELTSRTRTADGIELVTGVEVRAGLYGTKVELLGYFVDPENDSLQSLLDRVRGYRRQRNRKLVENVVAVTGIETTYEELDAEVEGALGRPHLADLLVDRGVVESIGEAFEAYLGDDGECYVEMERAPYDEVLEAITVAGGAVSLAHPGRVRTDAETVHEMVETLAEAGLDGIEVWYPYSWSRDDEYADVDVDDALALADEFDLIPTGGSDCHGPGSGKFRVGEVRVPRDAVERLRDAADV